MSKKRKESEKSLKSKGSGESSLHMLQDFHAKIDDPEYVEKLRALYTDFPCPETIVDLGYQVIYQCTPLLSPGKPSRKESKKSAPRLNCET